jgi:hypothetical protein
MHCSACTAEGLLLVGLACMLADLHQTGATLITKASEHLMPHTCRHCSCCSSPNDSGCRCCSPPALTASRRLSTRDAVQKPGNETTILARLQVKQERQEPRPQWFRSPRSVGCMRMYKKQRSLASRVSP